MRALTVWLVALIGALAPTGSTFAAPPSRLTKSGRVLWNLEALLHDTFGNKPVYMNYSGGPDHAGNFSTKFIDEARSRYFIYTFAEAHRSSFRLSRPESAPKSSVGVAGGETPLTIHGAYISCVPGKWLYEHWGQGPENWQIDCLPAP